MPMTSWRLKEGVCEKVWLRIFWRQHRNRAYTHDRNPSDWSLDKIPYRPAHVGPLPSFGTAYKIDLVIKCC